MNFFHSVTYSKSAKDPYNYSPKDSRMGKNISKACVRLQVPNAKYIYDKMPNHTRVVVY